jgi:hypothetical protein
VGVFFLGGIASAQQGLVVEPWRQATAPQAKALAARALPASGLPPASAALPQPRKLETAAPAPVEAKKWSPPVVELLVNPWAKSDALASPSPPRWVPETHEIIDPWADAAPEPPRVARRPTGTERPHLPIF